MVRIRPLPYVPPPDDDDATPADVWDEIPGQLAIACCPCGDRWEPCGCGCHA